MYKTGLYWFTNDLRLKDNPALLKASKESEKLICVYALDPRFRQPEVPQATRVPSLIGSKRYQFLYETLENLAQLLNEKDQRLLLVYETPVEAISKICKTFNVNAIFKSQNAGHYENRDWLSLYKRHPDINFHQITTHTIFTQEELPFQVENLPASFSKFRKMIEPLANIQTCSQPARLPPPPLMDVSLLNQFKSFPKPKTQTLIFQGGETAGLSHLQSYMDAGYPSNYKQVRNHLDGWENSTKFSPWLANGSLSAKQVIQSIQAYEQQAGANESTYWIIFELLWREYFQWYAHAYTIWLFAYRGIKDQSPLTSFYPELFQRWSQGNTPYPIVNACMKQLNATGYMSNRGRQIVASCFVNELKLDWRYGAAYFEQQLIDYDVAVNWGNWQYLAGVGADPRGKRHFDLKKQTEIYDPKQTFLAKWDSLNAEDNSPTSAPLHSVDAADWPIT